MPIARQSDTARWLAYNKNIGIHLNVIANNLKNTDFNDENILKDLKQDCKAECPLIHQAVLGLDEMGYAIEQIGSYLNPLSMAGMAGDIKHLLNILQNFDQLRDISQGVVLYEEHIFIFFKNMRVLHVGIDKYKNLDLFAKLSLGCNSGYVSLVQKKDAKNILYFASLIAKSIYLDNIDFANYKAYVDKITMNPALRGVIEGALHYVLGNYIYKQEIDLIIKALQDIFGVEIRKFDTVYRQTIVYRQTEIQTYRFIKTIEILAIKARHEKQKQVKKAQGQEITEQEKETIEKEINQIRTMQKEIEEKENIEITKEQI